MVAGEFGAMQNRRMREIANLRSQRQSAETFNQTERDVARLVWDQRIGLYVAGVRNGTFLARNNGDGEVLNPVMFKKGGDWEHNPSFTPAVFPAPVEAPAPEVAERLAPITYLFRDSAPVDPGTGLRTVGLYVGGDRPQPVRVAELTEVTGFPLRSTISILENSLDGWAIDTVHLRNQGALQFTVYSHFQGDGTNWQFEVQNPEPDNITSPIEPLGGSVYNTRIVTNSIREVSEPSQAPNATPPVDYVGAAETASVQNAGYINVTGPVGPLGSFASIRTETDNFLRPGTFPPSSIAVAPPFWGAARYYNVSGSGFPGGAREGEVPNFPDVIGGTGNYDTTRYSITLGTIAEQELRAGNQYHWTANDNVEHLWFDVAGTPSTFLTPANSVAHGIRNFPLNAATDIDPGYWAQFAYEEGDSGVVFGPWYTHPVYEKGFSGGFTGGDTISQFTSTWFEFFANYAYPRYVNGAQTFLLAVEENTQFTGDPIDNSTCFAWNQSNNTPAEPCTPNDSLTSLSNNQSANSREVVVGADNFTILMVNELGATRNYNLVKPDLVTPPAMNPTDSIFERLANIPPAPNNFIEFRLNQGANVRSLLGDFDTIIELYDLFPDSRLFSGPNLLAILGAGVGETSSNGFRRITFNASNELGIVQDAAPVRAIGETDTEDGATLSFLAVTFFSVSGENGLYTPETDAPQP